MAGIASLRTQEAQGKPAISAPFRITIPRRKDSKMAGLRDDHVRSIPLLENPGERRMRSKPEAPAISRFGPRWYSNSTWIRQKKTCAKDIIWAPLEAELFVELLASLYWQHGDRRSGLRDFR